ncbi:hypothetical protein [Chitinophaga sp. 212800010-3]|uniref:hypothetical protein n=1 Tax=unclassified Chitinophaga TaxID=2619133 RepID=UPI002DE3E80A|nr:hypothetical protein [Chitinophaga sp. 212800010-3]
MKKAKLTLTVIAILAIIGAAAAFNANRQLNTFYAYGSTNTTTSPGGPIIPVTGCVIPSQISSTTSPGSGITIPYSSAFNSAVRHPALCIAEVVQTP